MNFSKIYLRNANANDYHEQKSDILNGIQCKSYNNLQIYLLIFSIVEQKRVTNNIY